MAVYQMYGYGQIPQFYEMLNEYVDTDQWLKCSYGGSPAYIHIVSVSKRGVEYNIIVDSDMDLAEFLVNDFDVSEDTVRSAAAAIRYMSWYDFHLAVRLVEPVQAIIFDDIELSNASLVRFIGKEYWVKASVYGQWDDVCFIRMLSASDTGVVKYNYFSEYALENLLTMRGRWDFSDHDDVKTILNADEYSRTTLSGIKLILPVEIYSTDEIIEAWHQCPNYDEWAAADEIYEEMQDDEDDA